MQDTLKTSYFLRRANKERALHSVVDSRESGSTNQKLALRKKPEFSDLDKEFARALSKDLAFINPTKEQLLVAGRIVRRVAQTKVDPMTAFIDSEQDCARLVTYLYVSNSTQRVWCTTLKRRVAEREMLNALQSGPFGHLRIDRMNDYFWQASRRCQVFFVKEWIEAIVRRVERARQLKKNRQAYEKTLRSEQTGRRSNIVQSMSAATRKELFPGWFYDDMEKAYLGVMGTKSGDAFSIDLYKNRAVRFPELAAAASCQVSQVKSFINQAIICSAPIASKGNGWMNEAMELGQSWEDAKWSLVVLTHRLSALITASSRFFSNMFPGRSRGDLRSEASCQLMRWISDVIIPLEDAARAMGIRAYNVHDAILSDRPIPQKVWDAALATAGLMNISIKRERFET